jgi:hypothetical protein
MAFVLAGRVNPQGTLMVWNVQKRFSTGMSGADRQKEPAFPPASLRDYPGRWHPAWGYLMCGKRMGILEGITDPDSSATIQETLPGALRWLPESPEGVSFQEGIHKNVGLFIMIF